MQRSQDEVDEIVYGRVNQMIQYRQMPANQQRYLKDLRRQQHSTYSNGINRSSSSSRTVDVYYDNNLMTRSSDNYE